MSDDRYKNLKISVCVATFNGAVYIQEQIESVLHQLKENDELIICDDVSTDNTVEVIRPFLVDKRIILRQNTQRMGVAQNFEQSLKIVNGDYIFLCDQDDIWLEHKITNMIAYLEDNILAISDCIVVDANLSEMHPSFFSLRKSGPGFIKNIYKNSYLGCCIAFRKELLPHILPIPQKVPMHDMWIGLVAETVGKTCFIPDPLIKYRRHGKNASPTAEKSAFNVYEQIQFRLLLVYLIVIRYFRNLSQKSI